MTHHPIFNHAGPMSLSLLFEQIALNLHLDDTSPAYSILSEFPRNSDMDLATLFKKVDEPSRIRLMVCQIQMLKEAFYQEAISKGVTYNTAVASLIYEVNNARDLYDKIEACANNSDKRHLYDELCDAFEQYYSYDRKPMDGVGSKIALALSNLLLSNEDDYMCYHMCTSGRRLLVALSLENNLGSNLDKLVELFGLDKSANLEDCLEYFKLHHLPQPLENPKV